MKKIKLLYDVAKAMKSMERIDGILTAEVHKDQALIFSLRNKFEKDRTGKVKADISTKMNVNGEDLSRESKTEFTLKGDCHHGPCRIWRSLHRHHCATDSHRFKGVFHRISMALGVLASLKVEEQTSGALVIALNVSDLPEEIQEALVARIREKHGQQQDCCMPDCRNLEIQHGLLVMNVNDKHVVDKVTVKLDGRVQDRDNLDHSLAATIEAQFAW